MAALDRDARKLLETTEEAARDAAERAVQAVFDRLALDEVLAPVSLRNDPFRLILRERARQLGRGYAEGEVVLESNEAVRKGAPYLKEELAYEIWHRMLFARFLAENGQLIHPEYGALSLADCAGLAEEAGDGRDAWDVAAEVAASRLPGLFGAAGLSARLTLAPEDKQALERLIERLPGELFRAPDALGWVYQYWQKKKKEEVNKSERKIGGADLAAVTQLFTEDYMVRFLLENSLGAWWAARHPDSPLLADWRYLRFLEPQAASPKPLDEHDGQPPITHDPSPTTHDPSPITHHPSSITHDPSPTTRVPAAGRFETWPERAAEVTVMDPCCGSGHFLVVAFEMLRRMRMEEEGLNEADAADAVLRDNLFGLELDARCTQIATFAVALEAWKVGGHPERFVPQIACSGTPVKGQVEEWKRRFAKNDPTLAYGLEQLHALLKDAPALGSLIDREAVIPKADLWRLDWDRLVDVVERTTPKEQVDAETTLFGDAAADAARVARLLGGCYTLVATNVPYLARGRQAQVLTEFSSMQYPTSKADLATVFIERSLRFVENEVRPGTVAIVAPQTWLFLGKFTGFRRELLETISLNFVARLGTRAFRTISGEVVNVALVSLTASPPSATHDFVALDAIERRNISEKQATLRAGILQRIAQDDQLRNPDHRISLADSSRRLPLLEEYADGIHGLGTKDSMRFIVKFWELNSLGSDWTLVQSSVSDTTAFGGLEHAFFWEQGRGALADRGRRGEAILAGGSAHGKPGVLVSQVGSLQSTLYLGRYFEKSAAVVQPRDPNLLAAIWAFCSSPEFPQAVRRIDTKLNVTNATLVKVPFDLAHWQRVADEQYPNGLPEPHSDDPTQWLFEGTVPNSEQPLQVAVARLLGYRWPEQADDGLDHLADPDGIVCLPAVAGEQPAEVRVRDFLAAAYGQEWSAATLTRLLDGVGATDLTTWLRDRKGFFAQHTRLFHNRPFIWQIGDGRRDGFSALVNYHRLTPAALQKLIYTYLGDWLRQQRDAAANEVSGAQGKLEAALKLEQQLKAIAHGEPPYDIYVRWKSLAEQPIGWDPDLNDGVRLNIRPFVTAGVLHSPFSINWNKDRGKDPARPAPDLRAVPADRRETFEQHYSVDRWNDLHFTRAEKEEARRNAVVPDGPTTGAERQGALMPRGGRGS